ncbi:MAG: M48 family metallopeptidase [Saprospiraceae bacterium]|nr:M48 family metallopeptidase [Saprospiraceae bacterium]
MPSIQQNIKIGGKDVPFKIFVERRKSVRVSFGKSAINLRMPSTLSNGAKEEHYKKAVEWVRKKVLKNPSILIPYEQVDYDNKKSLFIYGKELNVEIEYQDRKTGRGGFEPKTDTITLILPNDISGIEKNKMIKQLLSRVCAQLFLPEISTRVHEINDKCFHKTIKSVNLKYNSSNWGSCSSAKNVNLSTRLLFAPKDVIDYVIIHELAHLYEMNHSKKFWGIVAQVMPNYKEKEKWLSENGRLCDF